ncbi:MAG: cyclase family protein [Actinobacteria bacterium]|nr:cyclase family protein [Actinomycetota bacterium]MBM4059307.1 cyclase family protein [Planctomycetota bacterium]
MTSTDARPGNWGRWGDDDERGTLNLITPDRVRTATQTCRTGKVYNLGLPVARHGTPVLPYRGAPQRLTLTSQTDDGMNAVYGCRPGVGSNEDVLVIAAHNGTHMDALCHVYADEQLYNGRSAHEFASHNGAPACGIEKAGGFAGRAVVLDVAGHHGVDWLEPGYNVTADDLEATRAAAGVDLGPGDILLVRTGWLDQFADHTARFEPPPFLQPGLGASTVDYIADCDLAAVGCDNSAVEVIPFDGEFLSLHIALLVHRGVTLLEHLVLTPLTRDGVTECLLVVAPLLVTGGTGSPVNPIAIA